MKKLFIIAIMLLFSGAAARAEFPFYPKTTASLAIGSNNNKEIGLGLTIRYKYLGIGFSGTLGEKVPSHADYACSHYDYETIKYKTGTNSLDLVYYFDFDNYFSLYGGAGLGFEQFKKLQRSNASGDYFAPDGSGGTQNGKVTYQAGVLCYAPFHVLMGCGYHSLIGPKISIGYIF